MTDNHPIGKHGNQIGNRITFRIKTRYYLELLTPEIMKLLGSTKIKINKDEKLENVPHLQIPEVVLVHCNFVNKIQESCIHLFLINHLVICYIFHPLVKTFNLEFSYIEVWFTDRNSKLLEIKDKINIILVID